MTARFVLDEASWSRAQGQPQALPGAVGELLARLEVARERGEEVVKHSEYYSTDLGGGVPIFSMLFEPTCAIQIDRDIVAGLSLALDRVGSFDDTELTEYDITVLGETHFAPGIAWAHATSRTGHHVAVLPLPLNASWTGGLPVTVGAVEMAIHFVASEADHLGFFRSLIELENTDEAEFAGLAASAFPGLDWADDVWRGLGDLSRPYIERRAELVKYLGGLSDHGAASFHELRAGDPRDLPRILSSRVGAETSDENGAFKKHARSKQARTRRHGGVDKVFWWHLKIEAYIDRIHFLWEPPPPAAADWDRGRIVIGLFKDHCKSPGD